MTYLAPRQGLFAIIILISFFIQTTLLLISTDQQLDELKTQTGKRMLVQLIEEVKLPILSKDKVSLSVLSGRYTSENSVASLTIKDIDDEILLQTGQAQLLQGDTLSSQVILGDTVVGTVYLTLRDTSKGEIIASQWLFILGSFITHLLIWLIYGYIARPTRAQLAQLSRDVQEHLRAQNRTMDAGPLRHRTDTDLQDNDAPTGLNNSQVLNDYIRSQQSDGSQGDGSQALGVARNDTAHTVNAAAETNSATNTDSITTFEKTDNTAQDISTKIDDNGDQNARSTVRDNNRKPKSAGLVANRPLETVAVQIQFYDPNHLMDTLAAEKSKPYLALCTQLLQRTLDELLKQPLLFGVKVSNTPSFDAKGATVEFTSYSSHSKVGLAAMMFARAYVMLNQVTYMKHRELQRFALEVRVGVSDVAASEKMTQLLKNNAKVNDILALLPVEGIKQLSGHIQLDNLPNPTTIYERDCASLQGVSESMMNRLITVRDAVLLSATH